MVARNKGVIAYKKIIGFKIMGGFKAKFLLIINHARIFLIKEPDQHVICKIKPNGVGMFLS